MRALWTPLPILKAIKARRISWSLIFIKGDKQPYHRESVVLREAQQAFLLICKLPLHLLSVQKQEIDSKT